MQSIFLALVLAANPPAVPEEQQRPPVVPSMPPAVPMPKAPDPVKPAVSQYEQSAARAVAAGKPLVVFVGVDARPIAGAVVAETPTLSGYDAPAVVVSVPGGDWLNERAVLPATATDAQIAAAIRQGVQAVPIPFRVIGVTPAPLDGGPPVGPLVPPPARRDAELPAEVSAILSGMERYASARLTQVSGNRSGNGANWAVGRLSVPSKWSVPGGLDRLTGWSNQLYRGNKNTVKTWKGHVNDWENYGNGWGSEITYQREYGSGARFADVLTTAKGVFEVRIAERVKGEWRRSVPYRDAKAEPAGYVRVSLQQCAACHDGGMANPDAPGSGGYGSARIPGGGGVYSEALAGVE